VWKCKAVDYPDTCDRTVVDVAEGSPGCVGAVELESAVREEIGFVCLDIAVGLGRGSVGRSARVRVGDFDFVFGHNFIVLFLLKANGEPSDAGGRLRGVASLSRIYGIGLRCQGEVKKR